MIDPSRILHDFDNTVRELGRRGVRAEELTEVKRQLEQRRAMQQTLDQARAALNSASERIGVLMREGRAAEAEQARAETTRERAKLGELEAEFRAVDDACRDALLRIPNFPMPDAPPGLREQDNVIREVFNYHPEQKPAFALKPHWEIAEALGILDNERAAKLSGSMFALYRGQGAQLIRGLVRFALDLHKDKYEEILPPHFVRSDVFTGTGHLPKFEAEAYRLRDDDLWAIPTGEVPLMGMHREEILPAEELPKRYMAYTVCFRREAGSYGKDTRGTQRLHEFHKLELVKLVEPEKVEEEFQDLYKDACKPLQILGLPYRVVDLCCGDLTFSSARIWDLEVYVPGLDRWLEVSSIGIFTDFQTRRSNIRFRRGKNKPQFPYALNASGLATPRVWAALIEHGQQPDGSVKLPAPLVPYLGFDTIRKR